MSKLLGRLGALARDRRGSIGIIFGLSLIPMATLAGVAVDYANVSRLNARLKAAADAAALSAVRDYVSTSDLSLAQKKGTDVFNSGLKNTTALQDATIKFTDASSGANVTLTATYSGKVKTWFGGFIHVDNVSLSGSANASYVKQLYKNFYFVVDASESMGIAATQKGIDLMQSVTPEKCALACHMIGGGAPKGTTKSNEEYARDNKVTLRLDVVKQAIVDILTQVQLDPMGQYHKFVIYPFAYYRSTLNPPSKDYSALINQVNLIDLSHVTDPQGFTNTKAALDDVAAKIGPGGDGSTAETAQNFIFLMTDGVEDLADADKRANTSYPYSPLNTGPMDPANCAQLRDKGTVGVVYTTYLPMVGEGAYDATVAKFVNQIKPALQNCASAKFFFEGTSGDEIAAAMKSMFAQAAGRVRLSQ